MTDVFAATMTMRLFLKVFKFGSGAAGHTTDNGGEGRSSGDASEGASKHLRRN